MNRKDIRKADRKRLAALFDFAEVEADATALKAATDDRTGIGESETLGSPGAPEVPTQDPEQPSTSAPPDRPEAAPE